MALPRSVVYFPYIKVPPAPFMTRLLLYWENVATIVPDQWARLGPEGRRHMLGDFTSDLVDAGLVTMAVPTYDLHDSLSPFVEHLEKLSPEELQRRADQFENEDHVLVHKAKFVHHQVLPQLKDMRLMAEAGDKDVVDLDPPEPWMWLLVERTTAREFMAVLAQACADQAPGIDYLRVERPGGEPEHDPDMRQARVAATNRPDSLLALAEVDPEPERVRFLTRLHDVRARLLSEIFPAPAEPVTAEWILNARKRFGDLLVEFRLAVEREAYDLVRQDPGPAQDWNIELVSEELREKIRQIEEVLAGANIVKVEKVTFAVLKAIPGIGNVFSAAQAIADAAADDAIGRPRIDARLAYGAFLRQELEAA